MRDNPGRRQNRGGRGLARADLRQERAAVEEAGGGESEGFELAEQELIEHASHGDEHSPTRIIRDAALVRVRERHSSYWVGRVV